MTALFGVANLCMLAAIGAGPVPAGAAKGAGAAPAKLEEKQ
jgi:hypothetical protein